MADRIDVKPMVAAIALAVLAMPVVPPAALAIGLQEKSEKKPESGESDETLKKAGEIASQPARDIGAAETKIPPLLAAAAKAPYSMSGVGTCTALAKAIGDLNQELGPDFAEQSEEESKEGKIAEAGGRAVINSLIPFRGLVREVSGAAAADRRLQAAIDAGFARRGFLRGIHRTRGCKTKI